MCQLFEDDKGYLVTEMVWEEYSGGEEDGAGAAVRPKAARREADAKPKAAEKEQHGSSGGSGGSKGAKGEASSKPQKTMMSFFTKK